MQPTLPTTPTNRSVVNYMPNGAVGRVVFPMFFLLFSGLMVYAGMASMRSIHFRCDRASGQCTIASSLGPWSDAQPIPLTSIRSTRLETVHGKKGSVGYRVDLVTGSGNVELSSHTSSAATRNEQKAEIDRFLTDRTQASVDVDYDEPSAAGWMILVFAMLFVLVAWMLTWFGRVEIDWSTRKLSVLTVRWPLAPARRTFELGSVRDAVVHSARGRKGGTVYSVRLVIDGQEQPVPIMNMASSGRASKERAAAEIRAMLASR